MNAAPNASSAMYGGISEAKLDTRYPWFKSPGRYLVKTLGWRSQKNLSGVFADVWDVEIVHTYRGEHMPGEKYTRMRTVNNWGTHLSEIKGRAVALLTIANEGKPVTEAQVVPEVLQAITEANGAPFYGMPIVVEQFPEAATKSGKPFSPMHYFIPTAAELAAAGL